MAQLLYLCLYGRNYVMIELYTYNYLSNKHSQSVVMVIEERGGHRNSRWPRSEVCNCNGIALVQSQMYIILVKDVIRSFRFSPVLIDLILF